MSLNDNKAEVTIRFADAWKLAQEQIKKLQATQKLNYDASANEPSIREGDRVYVYTPAKKSGAAYKFARPFVGPYRVLKRFDTGVDVRLVSKPFAKPIRVALSRVRMCPVEISEEPQQQSMKELEEQVEYVNADVTEEELEEHEQLQEGNSVGGENEIECKTKLPLAEDGPDVIEGEEAAITTVAEHHVSNWKKQLCSRKKRHLQGTT